MSNTTYKGRQRGILQKSCVVKKIFWLIEPHDHIFVFKTL